MIAASEVFDLPVHPRMSDILTLMQTGFVWMPLVAMFLARDFWLYRQLRKQVEGAGCKECEYCLVGLEIKYSKANEYILCPECGTKNEFESGVLARADIDPTMLAKD